jgi:hypothetical protein
VAQAHQQVVGGGVQVEAEVADLSVPVAEWEAHLGHPLAPSSPTELAELRQTCKPIRDGNTTWHDHYTPIADADANKSRADQVRERLRGKAPAPPSSQEPKSSQEQPGAESPGSTEAADAGAEEPGGTELARPDSAPETSKDDPKAAPPAGRHKPTIPCKETEMARI